MSRKTGFHLFLADFYQREHHATGSSTEDWSETRQRIFRTALMKWKEQTYEMECTRKRLSEEAKHINYLANLKREQQLALQNEQSLAQQNFDSMVNSNLLHVLEYAIEQGYICPNGMNPRPPSILRPAALVDYAETQKASLDEAMDVGEIVEYQPTRDIVPLTDNSIVESVSVVIQHGQGLHGLADSQFGLSENIVARAAQIPGFVANSNLQFHAEHSHVSKEGPPIHVNSIDDIGCVKSCQQLCGRFCRRDIRPERIHTFRNAVDMVKNITRVLACKRNVKHGNTHFLSPQCKLPLLIICTPSGTYGRLAARFTFNPLETDWIWRDITRGGISDDVAFTVTLHFSLVDGSDNKIPTIDTMCEFAIWMSNTIQMGSDYAIHLFFEYDLHDHLDHVLLVRTSHESTVTTDISEDIFGSLIVPKKRRDPKADEDEAAQLVNALVSLLKNDTKPKKGRPPKSETASSAVPGLHSKSTTNATKSKSRSGLPASGNVLISGKN